MVDAEMNLLEYLRSKTQVDVDSLDVEGGISVLQNELGGLNDSQMDAYNELIKPVHAGLLKKSAALAKEIHRDYPTVSVEELAYEISMVTLAQTIVPYITGAILVMANPLYSYSIPKIVDNGQRLYRLCKYLQPGFDLSRMIVKVPSTWEGLQACRKLKGLGVQTLGTTLFTLEQAVLAAEAGCIYVSPFLNELKAAIDPTVHDPNPIFDVTVNIQKYYEQHSCSTRVKACAALEVEQILKLAGVAAFTAPADQLQQLASMTEPAPQVMARSLFFGAETVKNDAAAANGDTTTNEDAVNGGVATANDGTTTNEDADNGGVATTNGGTTTNKDPVNGGVATANGGTTTNEDAVNGGVATANGGTTTNEDAVNGGVATANYDSTTNKDAVNGNAVNGEATNGVTANKEHHQHEDHNKGFEKLSFVDDESAFRLAFAKSDEGRGQLKTSQALNIFCEYQIKGEALMRDPALTNIG